MKTALIAVAAVVLVAAAGWFFVSPLFIDEVVDEDFLASVATMGEQKQQAMKSKIMQAAAQSPDSTMAASMPPDAPAVVSNGTFVDADAVHKGSGDAKIYRIADGQHLVRLENFRVTNGPALVVYLAEHPSPKQASDVVDGGFINLGKLKGNVGNQNYSVPTGTEISKYNSVVIWCELFGVLFSPAALETQAL